jgi:RNA polymerase sigma-70 factor (ECF subfamily)
MEGKVPNVPETEDTARTGCGRTDQELLEAWRAGDKPAGTELFQRHYAAVYRFFCNKLTGDRRDLIQQTFLACVEGRDRLRSDDRFRSYLFGVACNTLRSHLRSKYDDAVDLEGVSVLDLNPGPDEIYARSRERLLLLKALRRIPIERQLVLELRYWEDLESTEIAEILGVPDNTVRSRLARARDDLRAAMEGLAASAVELASTVDNLDA